MCPTICVRSYSVGKGKSLVTLRPSVLGLATTHVSHSGHADPQQGPRTPRKERYFMCRPLAGKPSKPRRAVGCLYYPGSLSAPLSCRQFEDLMSASRRIGLARLLSHWDDLRCACFRPPLAEWRRLRGTPAPSSCAGSKARIDGALIL